MFLSTCIYVRKAKRAKASGMVDGTSALSSVELQLTMGAVISMFLIPMTHYFSAGFNLYLSSNMLSFVTQTQLMQHELIPEEFGGDIGVVGVSALKRQGIEELLERVLLEAEILEFNTPGIPNSILESYNPTIFLHHKFLAPQLTTRSQHSGI